MVGGVFLRWKGLFFSTFIILRPFSGVKLLSSDFHTPLEGAQLRLFFFFYGSNNALYSGFLEGLSGFKVVVVRCANMIGHQKSNSEL